MKNIIKIGLMIVGMGLFANNNQTIDNEKIKSTLEQESKKMGCDKIERMKDESDINFSERIRKCMIISLLSSINEILKEDKQ